MVQSFGDYEKAEEERDFVRAAPDVGRGWWGKRSRVVQALADHLDMGRVVPGVDQPFLRELIHPPFRIVYRRDPQRVRVVRVWRNERLRHLPAAGDEGS